MTRELIHAQKTLAARFGNPETDTNAAIGHLHISRIHYIAIIQMQTQSQFLKKETPTSRDTILNVQIFAISTNARAIYIEHICCANI